MSSDDPRLDVRRSHVQTDRANSNSGGKLQLASRSTGKLPLMYSISRAWTTSHGASMPVDFGYLRHDRRFFGLKHVKTLLTRPSDNQHCSFESAIPQRSTLWQHRKSPLDSTSSRGRAVMSNNTHKSQMPQRGASVPFTASLCIAKPHLQKMGLRSKAVNSCCSRL